MNSNSLFINTLNTIIFEIKISYILGHNSILTYSELFWMVRFFFEVYIKLLNGVSCECLNTPVLLFFYSIFVCNVQHVALITFQKKSSNISSSSDGTFLQVLIGIGPLMKYPFALSRPPNMNCALVWLKGLQKWGRSILEVWKKYYNLGSTIRFI